ncbi:MAG: hypothetical protein IT373_14695 [Polyangiaceae bacterium]|nr:hypothetical protein [Polyangiaceae bacterium]
MPARALDLALAASAASWAVLGLVDGASPSGVTVALLNACAALAFATRHAARARGVLWSADTALCLCGAALGGVVLGLAPPGGAWPLACSVAFALGGAVAVAGLASLGRSFAVLPALRGRVVRRGAYRLVRHPVYAGELAMVLAAASAAGTPAAWAVALVASGLALWRIRLEEHLLGGTREYKEYALEVRWRLCPGLY